MKRLLYLFFSLLLFTFASSLIAQDEAPPIAPAAMEAAPEPMLESAPAPTPTLGDVILSSGVLGVLIWLGIILWGIVAIPLGIVSIVSSVKAKPALTPLAIKLLVFGAVCVVLLGCLGFTHGMIRSFFNLAIMESSSAQQAMLCLNVSHALYSLSVALMVCHVNLLSLLAAIIIFHFKHNKTSEPVGMNRWSWLFLYLMVLAVQPAFGQEAGINDFIYTTGHRDYIGVIPWIGVFVCALLTIPLGLLSIVHSRKVIAQWPLATKLLLLVCAWCLVFGLTVFAQGAIYSFATWNLQIGGDAQRAIMSLCLCQSLYPIAASLVVVLLGLLFLMCSALVRHRALKNIAAS